MSQGFSFRLGPGNHDDYDFRLCGARRRGRQTNCAVPAARRGAAGRSVCSCVSVCVRAPVCARPGGPRGPAPETPGDAAPDTGTCDARRAGSMARRPANSRPRSPSPSHALTLSSPPLAQSEDLRILKTRSPDTNTFYKHLTHHAVTHTHTQTQTQTHTNLWIRCSRLPIPSSRSSTCDPFDCPSPCPIGVSV